MSLTGKERKLLRKVENSVDKALRKQTQEGFYKVFKELGCTGVAKEIKAGRNVTGNVAYGIKMCVHSKVGPTVNVETGKFNPMTNKGKKILTGFIGFSDKLLLNGGFKPLPSDLYRKMRERDKAFEKRVKSRKWK